MPVNIFSLDLSPLINSILSFSWVLYLIPPVLLLIVVDQAWLYYAQTKHALATKWTVLEIRIPRLIEKGPKVMEQFFYALHGLRNAPSSFREKYIDGDYTKQFSFEMASIGGRTHFFVRVPAKLKTVVESMLYGSYQDIEIQEVEDYIDQLPPTFAKLQTIDYDLAGVELALDKESAYPMLTYDLFEKKEGDERILDTLSILLEMFGKLKPEEIVWMQMVVAPLDDNWQKQSVELARELKSKFQTTAEGAVPLQRTPGEEAKIKTIEKKSSKPGFRSMIRYVYFAPKAAMDSALAYNGFSAYFSQFVSDTNGLKRNNATATRVSPYKFPYSMFLEERTNVKKEVMLASFRNRGLGGPDFIGKLLGSPFLFMVPTDRKTSILNAEELATIFHMPTDVVLTAPVMERIESKRVSPPSNLPQ